MDEEKIVTIQKTSKKIKMEKLAGAIAMLVGVIVMFSWRSDVGITVGFLLLAGGFGQLLYGRIAQWWHHD